MEAKAVAKYLRMSPTKLAPVADLVRGKNIDDALTILKFTPGKSAEYVEKVVQSAMANAENNFNMDHGKLYVAQISVNQGPTMKRWRAGAQGRAGRGTRLKGRDSGLRRRRRRFTNRSRSGMRQGRRYTYLLRHVRLGIDRDRPLDGRRRYLDSRYRRRRGWHVQLFRRA